MDKFQDINDLSDLLSLALNEAHIRVMDQNKHLDNKTQIEASFLSYTIAISSFGLALGIPKDNFMKLIEDCYNKVKITWEDHLKEKK